MTEELKLLAWAATPGPWESAETRVYLPHSAGGFDIRNSLNAEANAAYIAAASPDAILALIEERDRLREALESMLRRYLGDDNPAIRKARKALGAQS